MPIPRFWSGHLNAEDLDPAFVLPLASVAQATFSPDKVGVTMVNRTGSTITKGQLVYGSSWDAPAGMVTASLAAATAQATRAQWIAIADVANNATGKFGLHVSLTGQNTNAATVGDAVYLSATPGGYVLTNP